MAQPCFQKVVYGDFEKKKKKVFCNHSRWLAVTRCSDPCFKWTVSKGYLFSSDLLFQCKPTSAPLPFFFSVLYDRSCLRVTAGPTPLDLDVNVQRTLDNNLATEAYERRIKRLEQEKLELSRKLQGKYILKIISSLFVLDSQYRNCLL